MKPCPLRRPRFTLEHAPRHRLFWPVVLGLGLAAAALARGVVAPTEAYAIVLEVDPINPGWYREDDAAADKRIVNLPLELPKTAFVRAAGNTTVVLSLPRGRVSLSGETWAKVEDLNGKQPALADPAHEPLRHFLMGGGNRGGRTLVASPAEMSTVAPATFVVELSAGCPAGPAMLKLADARRQPLASELFRREHGETSLASDAFRMRLAPLRGQAAWLSVEINGAFSEVLFQVISERTEAQLRQELALADAETEPAFRHLIRAYTFEKCLLLREAYGELVAAANAGREKYPRLAKVAADFATKQGLSLPPTLASAPSLP